MSIALATAGVAGACLAAPAPAAARVDVSVRSVSIPRGSAVPGARIAVRYDVRRRGRGLRRARLAIRLSRDARAGRGDAVLGRTSLRALRRKRRARGRLEVRLSRGVEPGRWRVIACAERVKARPRERARRNNCRAARRRLRVRSGAFGPIAVPPMAAPGSPQDAGTATPPAPPAPTPAPIHAPTPAPTPPPAPSGLALTYAWAAGNGIWPVADAAYYQPATPDGGLIRVTASPSGPGPGFERYQFPEDLGAGWSVAERGADTAVYRFTEGADQPEPAVVTAFDAAGTEVEAPLRILADTAPPVSSATCNGGSCDGWLRGPVTVALSSADAGAGTDVIRYTRSALAPDRFSPVYLAPFETSVSYLRFVAEDHLGNRESADDHFLALQIDDDPPPAPALEVHGSDSAFADAGTVYLRSGAPATFTVDAAADDAGSGTDRFEFEDPGAGWTVESHPTTTVGGEVREATATYTFDGSGPLPPRVTVSAVDAVGLRSTATRDLAVDDTGPTGTIECGGAACAGSYTTAPPVTFRAADGAGSGVSTTVHTTDGSEPTLANGTPGALVEPLEPGSHTISFRAYDALGNPGPVQATTVNVTADAPHDLPPTLDAAHATAQSIGPAGGTLTATGADGSTFTLAIPPKALLEDTEITLTPVTAIAGLDAVYSGGLEAGFDLEPHGLVLMEPATLEVQPAAPVPAAVESPFFYNGDGDDVHPFPLDPATTAIRFQVGHFSGGGVASGTDADRQREAERALADRWSQAEKDLQDMLRDSRECALTGGSDCSWDDAAVEAAFDAAYAHADFLAQRARSDATLAEYAIAEVFAVAHDLALLTLDMSEKWKPRVEAWLLDDVPAIVANAYDDAWERCRRFDLTSVTALWRWARWGQVWGYDLDYQRPVRCLRFEVDADWRYEGSRIEDDGTERPFDLHAKARFTTGLDLSTGAFAWEQARPFEYLELHGADPAWGPFRGIVPEAYALLSLNGIHFNRGSVADAPEAEVLLDVPIGCRSWLASSGCTNWELFGEAGSAVGRSTLWAGSMAATHRAELVPNPDPETFTSPSVYRLCPPGRPAFRCDWQRGSRSRLATRTYERDFDPAADAFVTHEQATFEIYHRPDG